MDINIIRSFLNNHLNTRLAVEGAAIAIGVSPATMYRYKANPETISIAQAIKLSEHLGLPLANGAAWSKVNILESERRRLQLESAIADACGHRLQIVPAYTVNSEIPEVTRLILQADYGTRLPKVEAQIMEIRQERARLYDEGKYTSWEIWNGFGYIDFFQGCNRFKGLSDELREKQIEKFIASTMHPNRHRFIYLRRTPDLPMFGCFNPPGVALIRIDNIQLEYQDSTLVESFEDTFNNIRQLCLTTTPDEFISFLRNPQDTN